MVVRLHAAPAHLRRRAAVDDLAVRKRDSLRAGLDGAPAAAAGPYADRAARLVADRAGAIRAVLAHFDDLVARADLGRAVLTHGEPHAGNTLRSPTAGG
jgi:hypothetical protein